MNIDPKEIEMGTRIEHEHTKDDALARKIAMDHLGEDPQYYTKLKKAGLKEADEDMSWEDYKKSHGDAEIEDAYGKKHKVKDLDWHEPKGKRMAAPKKEGVDVDVEECSPCGCGTDEPHGDVSAVVMVGPNGVKNITQGDVASTQPQLTSSGLGKNGTPKPLASDKLTAPETKKVGANKIATSKTPSMPGAPVSADPMEHFGTALVNLVENTDAEYRTTLNNLSMQPNFSTITRNKELVRKLLEDEYVFCNGDMRDIKVKKLGLGLYKIFTSAGKITEGGSQIKKK